MYEEAAPPERLAGVARCVWRSASAGPKRIVPDGCLDLVVGDGEAFIAGPDTAAWSSVTRAGAELHGLRFVPGRAGAVLGVAADELRDSRVPLAELWGREGELLAERLLAGEVTPAEAVASRLPEVPPPDPAVAELVTRLAAGVSRVADAVALLGQRDRDLADASGPLAGPSGDPGLAAAAFADPDRGHPSAPLTLPNGDPAPAAAALAHPAPGHASAPLAWPNGDPRLAAAALAHPDRGHPSAAKSPDLAAERVEDPPSTVERRLRRRFVQAVGYGPATYLRVSRFQRAVALAPHSPDLASLAASAGYSDQAHLSRDCRALTGLTPRAYLHCGHHSA
ncbi:helix-turn-helix domain-containing protein [Amycolatopsis sp. SID8362]|uniref:helix-turn-helix domain-containing protein n=1 Tax=Amycolatopsis sp. SID8362 TaxID=2690346 RepID=UPI0028153FB4|nr:helix-turn-helix domain-containing protein [Amycolatopsis sp. SID8362]